MEEFEGVQHVDFVWRSRHPNSNMPTQLLLKLNGGNQNVGAE